VSDVPIEINEFLGFLAIMATAAALCAVSKTFRGLIAGELEEEDDGGLS
jgi:hypothetical protein